MPIASGAAGRVDVGVDTSTTWTPEGSKRKKKPVNRNCDSYLQRWVINEMCPVNVLYLDKWIKMCG